MKTALYTAIICITCGAGMTACNNEQKTTNERTVEQEAPYEPPAREEITYRLAGKKDSTMKQVMADSGHTDILTAINRTDAAHLKQMDSILVPDKFVNDVAQYSPFPFYVKEIKDINKIIFFSYPAQMFAAYENGKLVKTGPTNMGREKDPTPTGLYFTNWKAEETKSTFDDEWVLKWNFNIENKEGIGFHQYDLPGYPASHSCLRLREADAKYLYNWADEWVLKGTDNVVEKGTPVIVFGSYPFGSTKPWMALAQNPHALDITADQINQLVAPHKQEIMNDQQKGGSNNKDSATAQ